MSEPSRESSVESEISDDNIETSPNAAVSSSSSLPKEQDPVQSKPAALKPKAKISIKSKTIQHKRATTQTMIEKAIGSLSERGGSSLIAIKKYILNNFEDINEQRLPYMLKTQLKKSIENGTLIQIKQSFKFSPKFKKDQLKLMKKETKVQDEVKSDTKKVVPDKVEQNIYDELPTTSKAAVKKMKKNNAKAKVPPSKDEVKNKRKSSDKPRKVIATSVAIKRPPTTKRSAKPKAVADANVKKDVAEKLITKKAIAVDAAKEKVPVASTKKAAAKIVAGKKVAATKG